MRSRRREPACASVSSGSGSFAASVYEQKRTHGLSPAQLAMVGIPTQAAVLCIVAVVAVATYPGTVSPLRGLDPFGEAERDVWHGRESERDDIAKMVIAEGFRAGLLFG